MKCPLFLLLLVLSSFFSNAQWNCYNTLYFDEGTPYEFAIEIDTVHYPANKWQVGWPAKYAWHYTHTWQGALVTDTVNEYPAHDTSVFTLRMPRAVLFPPALWISLDAVWFRYKLDIDTAFMQGKMELSGDGGTTWYDMRDTAIFHTAGMEPNLKTTDTNWHNVIINMNVSAATYDTIFMRYTLASGALTASKKGWLIDDINIIYFCPDDIPEAASANKFNIYPNPTSGTLSISGDTESGILAIRDIAGREVYRKDKVTLPYTWNPGLSDGMYVLSYISRGTCEVRRVLVQK